MSDGDDAGGPTLVTGAPRRIGLAIAERFARGGQPVVLHASPRSAEEAELAAHAIRQRGGRAATAIADLADADSTERLIEQAREAFGPLRLLINNASIFEVDAAEDFALELYERQMRINLRAPLLLSRDFAAALPASRARPCESISSSHTSASMAGKRMTAANSTGARRNAILNRRPSSRT